MAVVLEAQGLHTSRRAVGDSPVPELRNIERHGRAVGEEVNAAETAVLEDINRNPAASTSRRDWGLPDQVRSAPHHLIMAGRR
jgi:hypothetical protein